MIEFLKATKNKTLLSELTYYALNIGLAVALLILAITIQSIWPALGLVLLSKWRVFAVRPRFWWTNLRSNLLDIMFGMSIVTLIWQNTNWLAIQIGFCVVFAVWLIFLKPLTKHSAIVIQAGVTQFVALWALFTVGYSLPQVFVVLAAAAIGYVAAHHVINIFAQEFEDTLLNLSWAFVVAALAWITWHWTIAYTPLRIPQISLVVTLLSFWTLTLYQTWYKESVGQRVDKRTMTAPTAFTLAGIALLMISNFFDQTSL